MKITSLLSMSDYISELQNGYSTVEIGNRLKTNSLIKIGDEKYSMIVKYKDFLKRPLEKGMFVPCDLDGNVLEIPREWKKKQPNKMITGNYRDKDYGDYIKIFNEAKERVLINGFTANNFCVSKGNIDLHIRFCNDGKVLKLHENIKLKSIEDLIRYNLTLTESAVNKYVN